MARTAKGTGEDNRQKILETAVDIIGEKGVDRTSLSSIAKARPEQGNDILLLRHQR